VIGEGIYERWGVFTPYNTLVNSFGESDLNWQQFTGLKDKSDKEIYDGDIIKYTQHLFNTSPDNFPTKTKVVKWRANLGAWNVYETAAGESDVEIIGNIFETPKLLEVAR
jgi:uncharacterized phage protein (TIGR01671 family)